MNEKPQVGIVMGSDSDLDAMKKCAEQLAALGVACEMRIISAHRTPAERTSTPRRQPIAG